MKHKVSGLIVNVQFNKLQLREAIIKRVANVGEIDRYDLKQSIINDLVNDGFLRAELGSTLMHLEKDEILEGELKLKVPPTEGIMGIVTRHYRLQSSEQTAMEGEG